MKKNNKGLVLSELLAIIAFIAVIFAFAAYASLQNGNKRQYEVFAQNARDFVAKVSSFRAERMKYYEETYLLDLIDDHYIKTYKNPFSGGGDCSLYESKVVFVTESEKYVTLRCGNYLIDSQLSSSGNYRVYKVSDWQEKIGNSLEAETAKLYNYQKNGKMILDDFVISKELVEAYNKNESKNIRTMDEIDSTVTIVSKTYYRTKKLVKENL